MMFGLKLSPVLCIFLNLRLWAIFLSVRGVGVCEAEGGVCWADGGGVLLVVGHGVLMVWGLWLNV